MNKNKKYNSSEINVFFSSDFHHSHVNIVKGTTVWPDTSSCRNFNSIQEMNQTIINGINNKVGENDILYNLGDWSFGHPSNIQYFRNQIICKNIHLILGNHDKYIRKNKDDIQNIFSSVQNYAEIQIDNQRIILFHYPIVSWAGMKRETIHLFGHVHSKYQGQGKSLDVGIDNYYKLFGTYEPFSYKEILKITENK